MSDVELAKLVQRLTPIELRKIPFQYAQVNRSRHNFNEAREEVGKDWLQLLIMRHSEINLRKSKTHIIQVSLTYLPDDLNLTWQKRFEIIKKFKKMQIVFNIMKS